MKLIEIKLYSIYRRNPIVTKQYPSNQDKNHNMCLICLCSAVPLKFFSIFTAQNIAKQPRNQQREEKQINPATYTRTKCKSVAGRLSRQLAFAVVFLSKNSQASKREFPENPHRKQKSFWGPQETVLSLSPTLEFRASLLPLPGGEFLSAIMKEKSESHCRVGLFAFPWTIQARILEWVAFPFCRGSSQPRNRTGVFCIAGGFFTNWAIGEAPETENKIQIQYLVSFYFIPWAGGGGGGFAPSVLRASLISLPTQGSPTKCSCHRALTL